MLTMTKPRKRKPGAGRPKGPEPPRKMIASFRGSEAFDEWAERLIKHLRIPMASALEKGLILLAEQEEFEEPAPER